MENKKREKYKQYKEMQGRENKTAQRSMFHLNLDDGIPEREKLVIRSDGANYRIQSRKTSAVLL